MKTILAAIVVWCWRHAVTVTVLSLLLTVALGWFAAARLSIDTDEGKLISGKLPFRQAEEAFDKAFPQNDDLLAVVIDGPTPEAAEAAVEALNHRLAGRHDLFHSVRRAPEEVFFRQHGLLFLEPSDLTALSDELTSAQPLLGSVAADPSLRGLFGAVNLALDGVAHGQAKPADLSPLLKRIDAAAAAIADGDKPALISWQSMMGQAGSRDTPRRVLLTKPVLQYGALEAGADAADAIRAAARDLNLTPTNGFAVRLTGPVALADANFATIANGMGLSGGLSVLAVGILLWLAVRSGRVVGAILGSLVVGLVATAAFAAATVGTLNPISVAFAVMFVGIAVDFAIQFVVRFRDCRVHAADAEAALRATAADMAGPLPLAAAATAVGFLSFLPTAYTGVSQLGLIAGAGMLIALIVDFTLLPALLALVRPPAEAEKIGLPLKAVDGFLYRYRRLVTGLGVALALAGAALLPFVGIDFNPLHLQDPKSEAVTTFLDLAADPDTGAYGVEALTHSQAEATALARRFDALPLVGHTLTLATFVPDKQEEKLAILDDLLGVIGPTLTPPIIKAPPTDAELKDAITATAAKLDAILPDTLLAGHLRSVIAKGPDAMHALDHSVASGLAGLIDTLRSDLAVDKVSLETLPADLRADWVTPDGRWRVEADPKDPPSDQAGLVAFSDATRAVNIEASGPPISMVESGRTVVSAFIQAGLTALLAVAVLLGLLLRRMLDAALVVAPLVIGGLLTVIGAHFLGLSLNFANIIALPLLLGIGVAFNIYFVINWRAGVRDHLGTATARAVLFSALTTGSAFGSLAVSPHLGTASMGLLLFLSLGLTVLTTFFWLPALFHLLPAQRPR